jgi:hypothetical protein
MCARHNGTPSVGEGDAELVKMHQHPVSPQPTRPRMCAVEMEWIGLVYAVQLCPFQCNPHTAGSFKTVAHDNMLQVGPSASLLESGVRVLMTLRLITDCPEVRP